MLFTYFCYGFSPSNFSPSTITILYYAICIQGWQFMFYFFCFKAKKLWPWMHNVGLWLWMERGWRESISNVEVLRHFLLTPLGWVSMVYVKIKYPEMETVGYVIIATLYKHYPNILWNFFWWFSLDCSSVHFQSSYISPERHKFVCKENVNQVCCAGIGFVETITHEICLAMRTSSFLRLWLFN